MKAIMLVNLDVDTISRFINEHTAPDENEMSIEEYVKQEMGWVDDCGIRCVSVITNENLKNKDEFIGKAFDDISKTLNF